MSMKIDDDGSVLAAVMLGITSKVARSDISRKNNMDKKADRTMYLCEECDRVWEYPINGSGYYYKVASYYSSVPSYGKGRKTCPFCKRQG